MNPNIIAGLVNRVYPNFDMFSFENRLKLQKFTYIMQSFFGLNIGYEFNWYHYGPYCMELTRDAFNVNFSEIPKLKFSKEDSEEKFVEFLDVIKDKDNYWLEIVASIHFLKKLGLPKEQIIETIKNKREYLNDKEQEKLNEFLGKEERDKMLKKMERNKKASKKRQDESAIRKFEAWEKSGYRTY